MLCTAHPRRAKIARCIAVAPQCACRPRWVSGEFARCCVRKDPMGEMSASHVGRRRLNALRSHLWTASPGSCDYNNNGQAASGNDTWRLRPCAGVNPVPNLGISAVDTFDVACPLAEPFGWSQGWIDQRTTVLVRITVRRPLRWWPRSTYGDCLCCCCESKLPAGTSALVRAVGRGRNVWLGRRGVVKHHQRNVSPTAHRKGCDGSLQIMGRDVSFTLQWQQRRRLGRQRHLCAGHCSVCFAIGAPFCSLLGLGKQILAAACLDRAAGILLAKLSASQSTECLEEQSATALLSTPLVCTTPRMRWGPGACWRRPAATQTKGSSA